MRSSLKYTLKKLGNIDKAIEIGVKEGKNAVEIVNVVNELYLVDPYLPYKDIQSIVTQKDQDIYKKEMLDRIAPYKDKVKFYQTTSEEASKMFDNEYFDYVYIDGDHSYEAVKKDLELWYPRVKKGGILAGHDFNKPHYGVFKAITKFAKLNNLKVLIIKQDKDWVKNIAISDWWICIE
jgi:hypothetical protein